MLFDGCKCDEKWGIDTIYGGEMAIWVENGVLRLVEKMNSYR